MEDLKQIQEFFSKPLDEAFTPSSIFTKDKNNPNFLYVSIPYEVGSGFSTALGKRTMSGQTRDMGSKTAMKKAIQIAGKLESMFNIEDIDVTDQQNGKVVIFAVSDNFENMSGNDIKAKLNTPMNENSRKPTNEHRWAIDLSEDFLNEWLTPGFIYKSKAEGMSTDDLIKLSKENRGDGTRVSFDRTDLQSEITSVIKTFFEDADPFAMKEQFGKTFKLIRIGSIREHYHILEDTRSKDYILAFFTGEISSPLGVSRQSFSVRIGYRQKGKSKAYVDWSYDGHSNDWPLVKNSKKVWDYYKEAYLAIPDNPEDDKRFVMNRRGVGKVSEFGKYKEIPKSFVSKIMEDPVLWLGFEGVPEFGSPEEIKEIFNTLNKKYYKQWQAANRTGTKGTLRNVKAWFTSLVNEEKIEVDKDTKFQLDLTHLLDKHVVKEIAEEVMKEKGYSKYLKSPDNPKGETPGLTDKVLSKILMRIGDEVKETIELGKNLEEGKLCPKGEAYRKRRMAAGEKSSAYLSGRAVKVCIFIYFDFFFVN